MTARAQGGGRRGVNVWRIAGWGSLAALLSLPAVAMAVGAEGVDWSASDFMVMGALLASVGGLVELAVRASGSPLYRAAAGVGVLAAFLIVWANVAVGMIGDEGDRFNLLFGGVILVALGGAAAARFRAAGTAAAMLATGVAHLCVSAAGYSSDPRGAVVSAVFAAPWFLSAVLFRKAAQGR